MNVVRVLCPRISGARILNADVPLAEADACAMRNRSYGKGGVTRTEFLNGSGVRARLIVPDRLLSTSA